jgi:hypothetical protein
MIKRQAPDALVRSALVWLPQLESLQGAYIAGGFIRAYFAGETPSDMDLYFANEECFNQAKQALEDEGWELVFETDRAITIRNNGRIVQLIRFIFCIDPANLIARFDFTVCAAALVIYAWNDTTAGDLILHDDFFEHLAGRILVFQGSPLPLSSLKRAIKYVKRGYSICDENLIALAEAISKAVEFDKPESVEQHMAGMDPDGGRRIRAID